MFFAGDAEFVHSAQTYAEEDGVVFTFEFGEGCSGDFLAEAEVHAERSDHFDFAEAVGGTEFVFGDAVSVEAAGEGFAFEHGDGKTLLAQFCGAGERSRSGADAGDSAEFIGGGFLGERRAIVEESIHGEALEAADFDGLLVVAMIDAGAFAEDVHRADAGAAGAEDVGVEDGERGAAKIVLGDFLDEARNVDVRGAGGGAGGVEAVEAAVGFGKRGLVSLAFAMTASRLYPTLKYALGHGRACTRVTVGGETRPVLRQLTKAA